MADTSQILSQKTHQFLEHLGVEAKVEVEFDEANRSAAVNLKCDNPGVLIGYHGETLAALQLVLAQHLKAQTGEWVNLTVNINDYRQRREQVLLTLADNTVEQVLTTGQPHSLPPMPAGERRIIHLHLTDHPRVKTESVGENRNRSVIISPKVYEKET